MASSTYFRQPTHAIAALRLLILLLMPWLALSQTSPDTLWVKWNGEWTTTYQRNFADWSYEHGSKVGRGHTLLWLGYSETSWTVGVGGKSLGPFQMDSTTAVWVASKMDLGISAKDIRAVLENDRETAADMALWYFEYWFQKHLAWLGAGNNHAVYAWIRAIKSYRKGYKYHLVSNELILQASSWVRFFKQHY